MADSTATFGCDALDGLTSCTPPTVESEGATSGWRKSRRGAYILLSPENQPLRGSLGVSRGQQTPQGAECEGLSSTDCARTCGESGHAE
jgi:hypothetical protein